PDANEPAGLDFVHGLGCVPDDVVLLLRLEADFLDLSGYQCVTGDPAPRATSLLPLHPSGESTGPMAPLRVALIFLAIAANTVLHVPLLLAAALVKALLPSA